MAAGRILAARFSARLGRVEAAQAERLAASLARIGLPVEIAAIPLDTWLTFMWRDKKNEGGRITLILLDALGRAAVVKDAPGEALGAFLAAA
mgnify:CR=1 FL=1